MKNLISNSGHHYLSPRHFLSFDPPHQSSWASFARLHLEYFWNPPEDSWSVTVDKWESRPTYDWQGIFPLQYWESQWRICSVFWDPLWFCKPDIIWPCPSPPRGYLQFWTFLRCILSWKLDLFQFRKSNHFSMKLSIWKRCWFFGSRRKWVWLFAFFSLITIFKW